METHHAQRPPKPGQGRRTHAAKDGEYAPCGARISAALSTSAAPSDVTCVACRARLRDTGDLPMTAHAQARRK